MVNALGVEGDTFVGPEQLPGTVSQPLAERQEVAQPERQDTDESVQLPRSHEELLATLPAAPPANAGVEAKVDELSQQLATLTALFQGQLVPAATQRRVAFADVADGLDRRVEERVRAAGETEGNELGGVSFAGAQFDEPVPANPLMTPQSNGFQPASNSRPDCYSEVAPTNPYPGGAGGGSAMTQHYPGGYNLPLANVYDGYTQSQIKMIELVYDEGEEVVVKHPTPLQYSPDNPHVLNTKFRAGIHHGDPGAMGDTRRRMAPTPSRSAGRRRCCGATRPSRSWRGRRRCCTRRPTARRSSSRRRGRRLSYARPARDKPARELRRVP